MRSIRERTAAGGEANGEVKSLVARVIYAFGQLTLVVIKILTGFIIFGLTLAACALLLILLAFLFGDATSHGVVDIAAWSNTSRTLVIAALLTMLIPLLLLIYVLFCLIASRKPSGRAALVVFLFWIATLVSTGWLALEEFGSWNRDGLHGLFAEPPLRSPRRTARLGRLRHGGRHRHRTRATDPARRPRGALRRPPDAFGRRH